MVGPEVGQETDAIAESVILIIRSAQKVVRPKPDQPDRRRANGKDMQAPILCLCNYLCMQ